MFVVVQKTWTSSFNNHIVKVSNNKFGTPAFSKGGTRHEFESLEEAEKYFDKQTKFLKNSNRTPEYFTELWLEEVVNGRTERQIYYLNFGR